MAAWLQVEAMSLSGDFVKTPKLEFLLGVEQFVWSGMFFPLQMI